MRNRLVQIVHEQLSYNKNKSLFYKAPSGRWIVEPSAETIERVRELALEGKHTDARFGTDELDRFVSETARKVIGALIGANQYLHFSKEHIQQFKAMYRRFFEEMFLRAGEDDTGDPGCGRIAALFQVHYRRVRKFLIDTNGREIFKKYREQPYLIEVVCAQYGAEFQAKLMGLAGEAIKEPVLDIGCGKDAYLVQYLRARGIQAYGVDRSVQTAAYTTNADWFEFPFVPNRWGTIVSHMAFSNHFGHHFFRRDGEYAAYILKFTEILQSLKVGGRFIFSPSIPFAEKALSNHPAYRFERYNEQTGIVTRLR